MDALWPRVSAPDRKAPVTILREQGKALGNLTANVLYGQIRNVRQSHDGEGAFVYAFDLISSPLNYAYQLFVIGHEIELYPVSFIRLDPDIARELHILEGHYILASTESEFLAWLKRIFNSRKTVGIIEAILAQTATA